MVNVCVDLIFIIILAALMFESEQLNGYQVDALALFLALIFSLSASYFIWVLATELWIIFFPYSILCFRDTVGDRGKEEWSPSDFTNIDVENFDTDAFGASHPMTTNPIIALQMQIESSNLLLAKQRDEIDRLKRLAHSNIAVAKAFSAVPRPPANKKLKHNFESGVVNPMMNNK